MTPITLGPGTVTFFPSGWTQKIEGLTITVAGDDVTDQCDVSQPDGTFTLPVSWYHTGPLMEHEFPQVRGKRKAQWKQPVYGPKRRTG